MLEQANKCFRDHSPICLGENILRSKLMIHATLNMYSALCRVVGDSKGGILVEKVHHMDYQKKKKKKGSVMCLPMNRTTEQKKLKTR